MELVKTNLYFILFLKIMILVCKWFGKNKFNSDHSELYAFVDRQF